MDWNALFSTLGLVFIAELGDKTQLAVVTQTCKHRKPWAVFLGASAALIAVTALGAIGGQILGQFIPERILRIAAALAFVVMGGLIIREAIKATKKASEDTCDCVEEMDCTPTSAWD
jgi:putative Ca2+/H+ antiporter (TMEM165/GDT1 family)